MAADDESPEPTDSGVWRRAVERLKESPFLPQRLGCSLRCLLERLRTEVEDGEARALLGALLDRQPLPGRYVGKRPVDVWESAA